jgi:predicted RNase H-like HicB family nuclease
MDPLARRDEVRLIMTHYVAIVEEEEGKAVWFPDLPGCVSAGDTLDEAMLNAAEALELWAEAMVETVQEFHRPEVSPISRPTPALPKI